MTFKISHKDKARIDSVALALRGQTGKLDDAVRIFNEQLGFVSVGIAIIAASILILWGLRRAALR